MDFAFLPILNALDYKKRILMRYCSHCVMPDTRPGIKFTKNTSLTGGGGLALFSLRSPLSQRKNRF